MHRQKIHSGKQQQKIFDCLKESEALAKIQAKYLFIMKNIFFSLAFMLIGSFAFANTNAVVTPKTETVEVLKSKVNSLSELNEVLNDKNFQITEVKYNDAKMICGFTLSYDNGAGNSWSTWYDCSGMTMGDIMNFIMIFFF